MTAKPIPAVSAFHDLLDELASAQKIITAMLNAMTPAQKSKVAAQLEADGVSPDGMTRRHERSAVIANAHAAMATVKTITLTNDHLSAIADALNAHIPALEERARLASQAAPGDLSRRDALDVARQALDLIEQA